MITTDAARYAIYFCPEPGTPLADLGDRWLGRERDAFASASIPLPPGILSEDWDRITESARRYGFHATLKPPFQLEAGLRLEDLLAELRAFAADRCSFIAPALQVQQIGRFLALLLSSESAEFAGLAAECVRVFDRFRKPASDAELARRSSEYLSEREREHLVSWGYPYVLDTWKFHMTLTCSLPQQKLALLRPHLAALFADACAQPLQISAICLLEEPAPGQPFHVLERMDLRRC